ncbi:potassium channel family protein [Methanobrevibacter olleyae]|uniref:Ion transport protein n=1 Tax=Methanobrevibacter olleyae TaxID=294671 RepID=A0A126R1L0_METOL|nr:potassium channel family protein [Methanobrevibacter olleyae]AMK15952.1 ion transport protein [Methanobrevibacter olleyae]SFL16162.1 voltage-gated potassium channel [Methanobrevibacter olleyae]
MNKKRIISDLGIIFDILIFIDLILIILSIPGVELIEYAGYVQFFDLTICALLLTEFFYGLLKSDTKLKFTKEHFLDLIASIPFDLIALTLIGSSFNLLNITRFLRLIRIIRVLRAVNIIKKYGLEKVIKRTGIDKILVIVIVLVLIFSLLLGFTEQKSVYDSFYFVIITLTTVGYGDDIITTPLGKLISVFLIVAGVVVFSTITGVISSFFTDRLLESGISVDENLHFINQKLNFHERELEKTNKELNEVKQELEISNIYSEELKKELTELKELIKEND